MTRITFVADLGNGRTEQRTTSGRAYTHAVVTEAGVLSWHMSERQARLTQQGARSHRISRGWNADGIAVIPVQRLDEVEARARRSATTKARDADPKRLERLAKAALSQASRCQRAVEDGERELVDLDADVREIRELEVWVGRQRQMLPTEVVVMTMTNAAGGYSMAVPVAEVPGRRERLVKRIGELKVEVVRQHAIAAKHQRALARLSAEG